MRGLLTLLIFTIFSFIVKAQESKSLSLEDCINYALENNEQLKIKQLEREIADAEVRKTVSMGLPQANVNGGLNYNFEPQKSLIDISTFDPSVPEGTEQEVSFVQSYDGNIGLSVDQLIFDGSYFVGLQAARTYKELSTKEHNKSQIDIVETVSKAYYNALIAEEQLELLEKNIGRLDTLLRETRQMYEAGFAEKVDVDRIRVNYNNLKVEFSRTKQLKDISRKLLKFQMGMNLNQPIQLSENLEDVEVTIPLIPSESFDYSQRIEFSQLQTNRSLAFLDMKNNKVQYLPKIYARLGYGWNTATSQSSQLFDSDRWLSNGVLGVTASIPIFDGFLKSNKIQQNKLQVKQIENQMSFLKKNIDLEIEQSEITLDSQLETLDVQKQNVELAQEVYDITKIKYQEGVGSNLEVIDADASLKEAQTNYLNALYQAIVTQIELKKALGTLYKN
ncbi:Outer membrane protein TolC [Ekhidna lutea]|uniref:Outer membrane protein TolC n=1 Tax=Ekhidna lutea TaxID=447679 RepID=A0A239LKM3_EKHLU|nr:TolC family protein [Ekhidna lutea]SNT30209.1 Outer membrane protein TolC [Ekhidna lutea]